MTTAIIPIKLKIDVLSQYQDGDAVPVEHGGTGVTSIEELKQLLGVGSGGGSEGILRFDPEYLNCTYENGEIIYSEVLPINPYENGFAFTQPLDLNQKIILPANSYEIGILDMTIADKLEYNIFNSLPISYIAIDFDSKKISINNNAATSYSFDELVPTHYSFQINSEGIVNINVLKDTDIIKKFKLKVQSNCRTLFFKLNGEAPMQLPISIS